MCRHKKLWALHYSYTCALLKPARDAMAGCRQLILHYFTVSGAHAGNFDSAEDDIGQEPINQPVL